jgi:hypothetical protein
VRHKLGQLETIKKIEITTLEMTMTMTITMNSVMGICLARFCQLEMMKSLFALVQNGRICEADEDEADEDKSKTKNFAASGAI